MRCRVRRVSSVRLGALSAVLFFLWPAGVLAQQPTFVLDRLLPPGAPDDTIVMSRPATQPYTIVFGQLGFGYQANPLRTKTVVNQTNDRRMIQAQPSFISHQLSWYPTVGIQLLNRITFTVSAPFYFVEGHNPDYSQSSVFGSGNVATPVTATGPAMGDTRLDLRGVIVRTKDERGAFGANLGIMAPSGDRQAFGGDGSANFLFGIQGEYDLKRVVVMASTGMQFRPQNGINSPTTRAGLGVGMEWRWALGAFMPFKNGKYRVGANVMGQVGIQADNVVGDTFNVARNFPWEWSVEGRMKLTDKERVWVGLSAGSLFNVSYGAPDFRVVGVVGFWLPILESEATSPDRKLALREKWRSEHTTDSDGDGIPDDLDACPSDPEDHLGADSNDGCPIPPDRDKDGIPDQFDKCPDVPEDKDGIDDGDGCPEDDADNDGIADAQDACPKEPGKPSTDPKKNGCPTFIAMEGNIIRILQQVHFQTGSANILAESFPMLQEIANVLKASPNIKRMSVEGHTDNRGGAAMNLKLSQDRAASVVKWLGEHGVEPGRLESHGYGLTKPVDSNDTDKGRAANRRVEFKITAQDDPNAPHK